MAVLILSFGVYSLKQYSDSIDKDYSYYLVSFSVNGSLGNSYFRAEKGVAGVPIQDMQLGIYRSYASNQSLAQFAPVIIAINEIDESQVPADIMRMPTTEKKDKVEEVLKKLEKEEEPNEKEDDK